MMTTGHLESVCYVSLYLVKGVMYMYVTYSTAPTNNKNRWLISSSLEDISRKAVIIIVLRTVKLLSSSIDSYS